MKSVLVVALAVVALVVAGCADRPVARPWAARTGAAGEVVAVLDGDTFHVRLTPGETIVRVIGIDTPEIAHEGRRAACHGTVAERFVRAILLGQRVRLRIGVEPNDRYGRTLADVAVLTGPARGRDLAELVARQGLARPLPIAPNTRSAPVLAAAVAAARRARRGLWGRCTEAAAFPPRTARAALK